MQPMLATRGDHVPSGPDWQHEVKWDGMRTLVEVAGGRVRVFSRNERDVSVSFPELAGLAEALDHDVLLDGEVVSFAEGVPSFGALADRMHVRDPRRAAALATTNPVTLLVFDLLAIDGSDLTGLPLAERRTTLEGLGLDADAWQVPPTYDDGELILAAAEQQGLEGVVSKRRDSRYHPGRRSREWLKFPIRPTGSFVVGGYRHETGSDSRIGAVLVGQPTPEGLRYRGRVGSGIAGRVGQQLLGELTVAGESPFVDPIPKLDAAGTVWVDPVVVIDVQYLTLTGDGRLRQPAYRGVRTDLTPSDLHDQT